MHVHFQMESNVSEWKEKETHLLIKRLVREVKLAVLKIYNPLVVASDLYYGKNVFKNTQLQKKNISILNT